MDFESIIKERFMENSSVNSKALILTKKINAAATKLIYCYKNSGKLIAFGNGGSAADAQHIVAELVSKFYLEREMLEAIALTVNSSILTAIANDYNDFGKVFERQIESLAKQNDVVLGISTSGNSENVIRGLQKAKEKGAITIALTGMDGGQIGVMEDIVDVLINVPSTNTPRIQEMHILIGHILCEIVESALFGKK